MVDALWVMGQDSFTPLGTWVVHIHCLGLDFCFCHNVSEADGGLGLISPRFLNKQLPGYHYFTQTSRILIPPPTTSSLCANLCLPPLTKCAPAAPIVTNPKLQLRAVLTCPNWSPQCDSNVTGSVTATEQQQWRGYKHNTCVKVPAEAKKKVKTEKQLKSLGGVFAFFKDREIEFLPLAKKFLNVSVFWIVFF